MSHLKSTPVDLHSFDQFVQVLHTCMYVQNPHESERTLNFLQRPEAIVAHFVLSPVLGSLESHLYCFHLNKTLSEQLGNLAYSLMTSYNVSSLSGKHSHSLLQELSVLILDIRGISLLAG